MNAHRKLDWGHLSANAIRACGSARLLAGLFTAGAVNPAVAQWTAETVDSTGDVGEYTSLVYDASGNPHISYFDRTNGRLKYAVKQNGAWQIEIVDEVQEATVGLHSAICIDAGGNIHIVHQDATRLVIRHAQKNKQRFWSDVDYEEVLNVWQVEDAKDEAGASDNGQYLSAANFVKIIDANCNGVPDVDPLKQLCISSYYPSGGDLHYAECDVHPELNVFAWHTVGKRLDQATGLMGKYSSVAVNADGWPFISYWDQSNLRLKCAFRRSVACPRPSEDWVISVVDDPPSTTVGQYTSIAIDALGRAHISYYDLTNRNLKRALGRLGDWNLIWSVETIQSSGWVGSYSSVACEYDNPTIAYYDSYNNRLLTTWLVDMLLYRYWDRETVDEPASADPISDDLGRYSSIKIDPGRATGVSYYDATNKDLKFASR